MKYVTAGNFNAMLDRTSLKMQAQWNNSGTFALVLQLLRLPYQRRKSYYFQPKHKSIKFTVVFTLYT